MAGAVAGVGVGGCAGGGRAVFRIERGEVTQAELAAVTVVLMLLATRDEGAAERRRPQAPWRPQWLPGMYRSPHQWR
ncbi:acyl-CoA carboxylase subunit epsilon [Streptomyces sp. NA04227]|uniref:acyl-CoA carboxylase subunit epsilon n=1 Tax=Streptomyces sp. NA04227 TaxID=2742136 RepID=UPI0015921CBC|nr:acyl-CoA carboxylase subunit epsilon [Streptomyces sp. NA04227]QKW10540.1 acyl-CoA carboxylase subunit epsilon [Streptomyces sp. NA04227]